MRAAAALGVVVFHLQPFERQFLPGPTIAPRWFALGDIGVDLFFVISGFIIVESTSDWFDRRHAGQFLWRRLTRIYPIYWFYNLVLLAMFWLQPSVLSANRQAPDLLSSFLLTPGHGKTLLLISWTLMYEVEFYLIFAACLFCMSRRQMQIVLAGWAAIIVARHLTPLPSMGSWEICFDLLNLDFIAGCFIACLWRRILPRAGLICLTAGLAMLTATCVGFAKPDGSLLKGWYGVPIGVGFWLTLAGAVSWERRLRALIPALVTMIGDSSYSLYLSHLLTLGLVGRIWRVALPFDSWINHVAALCCAILAAIIGGRLSYRLIERPLMQLSRILPTLRQAQPAA